MKIKRLKAESYYINSKSGHLVRCDAVSVNGRSARLSYFDSDGLWSGGKWESLATGGNWILNEIGEADAQAYMTNPPMEVDEEENSRVTEITHIHSRFWWAVIGGMISAAGSLVFSYTNLANYIHF